MEIYEKHNYTETIFDILNNPKNTMTSKIKDNIKNYLLIDCKKYIIKDFEYMIFNLKNIENINQYQKLFVSLYHEIHTIRRRRRKEKVFYSKVF